MILPLLANKSRIPRWPRVEGKNNMQRVLSDVDQCENKASPKRHPMTNIYCPKCGESFAPVYAGAPCPNCCHQCGGLDVADDRVPEHRAEVARELAKKHYEIESGITQIIRFTDPADAMFDRTEPIKLLEVNENTVASGVMPLYFGPAPASGIPYSSVIVEVTPDEYKKIQSNDLKLPAGWIDREEMSRRFEYNEGA